MTPCIELSTIRSTPTQRDYLDEHLEVDFSGKRAFIDCRRLILTRKEFELLAVLVRNAGMTIPRRALLQSVWGYGPAIRTRTLDVHIRRLREKIGSYSQQYIETIFGIGYRFRAYREPDRLQLQPHLSAAGLAA